MDVEAYAPNIFQKIDDESNEVRAAVVKTLLKVNALTFVDKYAQKVFSLMVDKELKKW